MKNVFILSGPAGSGKDAVIQGLEKIFPCERIITSTTRAPRSEESEGKPYHFLTREEFERKIVADEFIEFSTNENHELYGVTKKEIERISQLSTLVLWKMDWKGVLTAKKLFPAVQALLITAPVDILEARLRKRDGATHKEEYFQERMAYTREWFKHTDIYDFIIENEEDKLEETIERVRTIIEGKLQK